ncbi:MAG: DNA-processing protein DprA [Pseudomonadota bacterium]
MAKDLFPSTHPLTPPLTEEVWLDWLRLLRSHRVGLSTFYRLMGEYGSAAEALHALPEVASKAGVEKYTPASIDVARAELASARQAGVVPIAIGSDAYPSLLAEIDDPPPILWTMGQRETLNRPMLALVGARNASSLGTRMARKLARELGEAGFVIVSGMARGIDTAAHLAAVDSGTVAVLAGGVDVVYPPDNAVLAQEIAEKGLRISEMPMSFAPRAQHFPRRNRIISGMCAATIVIEAAGKSGSLITARNALDQGRDVLAVPGHPFDARSSGCNMLIRDGATLVRVADDVIQAISLEEASAPMNDPAPMQKAATFGDVSDLHRQILDRLSPTPVPEDQVIRDLGAPADTVSPEILALEIEGRIRRDAGGMISLTTPG